MNDVFSKKKRRWIMSRVKGKDTCPEKAVRRLLHQMGYRFRLHVTSLPGKPDIVLPRHRKVVLVHGCFWHGHRGCKRAARPQTNAIFWNQKIGENIRRDQKTRRKLRGLGWKVLVVWQCQIKKLDSLRCRLARFMEKD